LSLKKKEKEIKNDNDKKCQKYIFKSDKSFLK